MDFNLDFDDTHRRWLLLAAGADPQLCLQDPGIGEDRYVFVEATGAALFPIARGSRPWADAVADESVRLFGNPDLVTQPPGWFGPDSHSFAERNGMVLIAGHDLRPLLNQHLGLDSVIPLKTLPTGWHPDDIA